MVQRFPLPAILLLDGLSCVGMAAILLAAPATLGRWMTLPPTLLSGAGAVLLAVAAFILWLSRTPTALTWGLAVVVAGNMLWVVASLVLPLVGLVTPNSLGWTFLVVQAGFVAVLAWLEGRARPAPLTA